MGHTPIAHKCTDTQNWYINRHWKSSFIGSQSIFASAKNMRVAFTRVSVCVRVADIDSHTHARTQTPAHVFKCRDNETERERNREERGRNGTGTAVPPMYHHQCHCEFSMVHLTDCTYGVCWLRFFLLSSSVSRQGSLQPSSSTGSHTTSRGFAHDNHQKVQIII